MKKLYFIRHGESEGNAKRIFSGQADHPLTDTGRQQALAAAKQAIGLQIDMILTSPLKRAAETAEIIARTIHYPPEKILRNNLLMERNYGQLQGRPYEEIPHDRAEMENIPGVEPEASLLERAQQAAAQIMALPADNILIVGHGTMGRAIHKEIIRSTEPVEVPIEEELPNATVLRWV